MTNRKVCIKLYVKLGSANLSKEDDTMTLVEANIGEEYIIKNKVKEINMNLETLLRGGKSRVEGNSGCIKIFNAVHNHLGSNKNDYINSVENGNFIVKICIDLIALKA